MLKQFALAITIFAFTAAFHAASTPRDQTKAKQAATPTPKPAAPKPTMTSVPTTSGGTVPTPKGGGALVSNEGGTQQQGTTPTGGVSLWVKGGHGHWCRGIGMCFISGSRDRGPHCKGTNVKPEGENVFEGVGSINKKVLTLEFTTEPAERAESLPVDRDIVLDQCTSNDFGYNSVTILKGTYRVSYDESKYGKVALRFKASGPLRTDMKQR